MEGWITTRQAAEMSGYNRDWLTRLCQKGEAFKVVFIERRYWIEKADFERWVREQKAAANGRSGPRKGE